MTLMVDVIAPRAVVMVGGGCGDANGGCDGDGGGCGDGYGDGCGRCGDGCGSCGCGGCGASGYSSGCLRKKTNIFKNYLESHKVVEVTHFSEA